MKLFSCLFSILFSTALLLRAEVQNPIVIEPLFEYPVAPESLTSLEERTNYLMEHFWDKLDYKTDAVSQYALNDAFRVYATAVCFADRDVALKSIDQLLKKLKKNPTLLTQMVLAAEENFYGQRTERYSDEAYIPFLEAAVSNKKVPKIRRNRWENQLKRIKNSLTGQKLATFPIEERRGGKGEFEARHKMTIIEFGDPGCDDCRFSRLTLDTNVDLTKLVDSEKVEIVFIVLSPQEGWREEVSSYPAKWLVASSEGVDDIIDIRTSPSIYVLDHEGNIVAKNVTAAQAAAIAIEGANK
ncbi:MAG: DUF5106 domain-containing protein [Prevotella sp.]|nr:DUF5106 domain-containing protein [Bacteroides sp.]MCM1366064.1 DUF5106 domain-containing protein [Prevotella sp.]MCM1436549.1 DUF5106 domain-containing protein [Prevotella sp.]